MPVLKKEKQGRPGNAVITVNRPRCSDDSLGKNPAHNTRHSQLTQEALPANAAVM